MDQVTATTSTGAKLHFPIEGYSIWPVILWMLMFCSIGAVAIVWLILNMVEISNLPISEDALTGVIAGLLVLEYWAVLKLIVPNMTDYGRYSVHPDHVDFFPLVMLGLRVNTTPQVVPASAFKGVRIRIVLGKDRPTSYRVELVHPAKGKTLNLKNFLDMPDAEAYARELAFTMNLQILEAV